MSSSFARGYHIPMNRPAAVIVQGAALKSGIPSLSVPQFIRDGARQRPDRIAFIDGPTGRPYSYGELDRSIGRCAAGLATLGFKPGETLLMFAPNSPEWPIVALGALAAGGIVSGANPMSSAEDLAHQLRDATARIVFTVAPLLATARRAANMCGFDILILSDESDEKLNFSTLLACPDAEPSIHLDPDSPATLPYSSGTTGMPKGVLLSHRNLVSNIYQYMQAISIPQDAVTLALLPMFHIYGFTVVTLCGLASGATIVTIPRFEPESFLKAIARYRVSHLSVVPPLMHFLATHPAVDEHDLSSLQKVGCGAAPLSAALEKKVRERIGCSVAQGFGMTESSGVVATSDSSESRTGAAGQLLPGTEARIVDPVTLEDLPRGSSGELWFRGPQAFQGYLNQPTATASTITEDGWVRTGDIGYFDDDGYLYVTDRLKELIKVKGFQVAPAEIEAILQGHPMVADVAVIGRPDERAGEIPVAYLVTRGRVEIDEIKAWLAARVVDYKRIGDIVICAAIPKTPAGKILRRVLRSQDARRLDT
jgi:acyl-CoA synthetase (AMP-forming)/AMP-acid ligase II